MRRYYEDFEEFALDDERLAAHGVTRKPGKGRPKSSRRKKSVSHWDEDWEDYDPYEDFDYSSVDEYSDLFVER